MNIIKKIAQWILREDWEIANARIRTLQHEIEKSKKKLNDWELKSSINRRCILPQSAVKCIINCLPNPNEVAAGRCKPKSEFFMCRNIKFVVKLEKFFSVNNTTYVQIKINDMGIDLNLPLMREKIMYNMLGVNTEIDTYYWDFNFSNVKIVSDDVFDLISEFIVAQRKVLTEDF